MISGLPPLPDEIIEASEKGKLVIFIGAGFSKNFGCCDWNELARDALTAYNECNRISQKDYNQYIQAINRNEEIDYPGLFNFLSTNSNERVISLDDALNPSLNYDKNRVKGAIELLESILELKPRAIVTTNIDHLIEDVKTKIKYNEDNLRFSYLEECNPTEIGHKQIIFFIHGSLRHNKYIITSKQYSDYYPPSDKQFNRAFHGFISNIFGSYCILFLGYSLNTRDVLSLNCLKFYPKNTFLQDYYHFALISKDEECDSKLIEKVHRIKLIRYNPGEDWENFGKTITSWSTDFKERARLRQGKFNIEIGANPNV